MFGTLVLKHCVCLKSIHCKLLFVAGCDKRVLFFFVFFLLTSVNLKVNTQSVKGIELFTRETNQWKKVEENNNNQTLMVSPLKVYFLWTFMWILGKHLLLFCPNLDRQGDIRTLSVACTVTKLDLFTSHLLIILTCPLISGQNRETPMMFVRDDCV